jgi:hypothetical protein
LTAPTNGAAPSGNKVMQLVRRAANARAKPLPDGARRVLVVVAFALFVASGVWAWVNRPVGDVAPDWWLLAVALLLAVPGLWLKAVEYATTAHILGQRPPLRDCIEISVLSSAANLLPIPGSAIVTMRALSESGSTYGAAVTSTAAVSITWVAATLVYGGAGVAFAGGPIVLAVVLAAVGVALLVVAWRMIAVHAGEHTLRLWVRAVVIETAFILISTVRFWVILRAIGIEATVAQSVSLTIAATLANALAFVPGGLGIRELIAAGISPLVDLEAEAGLLMAVFDRVMWLTVLAVAALVVSALRRRAGRPPAVQPLDDEQGAMTS